MDYILYFIAHITRNIINSTSKLQFWPKKAINGECFRFQRLELRVCAAY